MAAKYRLKLKRLDFISAVDQPAQETALAAIVKRAGKADRFTATVNVAKVDAELGIVLGWALTSTVDGSPYHDLHGDAIEEADLVKIAYEYVVNGALTDEMHDGAADGSAPFIWPMTSEIAKALGIPSDKTGILVGIKPSADVLAKFKSGEYTGFSIAGIGERIALRKATLSTSDKDDLPDSAFLYVEPGGKKADGKTTPRSNRMFPYMGADGKIDIAHLRAACSDIPKSSLSSTLKEKCQQTAEKLLAAQHGDADDKKRAPIEKKEHTGKCTDGHDMPVDKSSCPECGAEAAYKRATREGDPTMIVSKSVMLTTATAGHTHLLDDGNGAEAGTTSYSQMMVAGQSDYGHSHPWARSSDGDIVIGEASGHVHEVLTADDLADLAEVDEFGSVAASAPNSKSTPSRAVPTVKSQPEPIEMKPIVLTEAHHAHYSKLSEKDGDAFVAKSFAERDAAVKAALDSDPVVFKGATSGIEVRKSDGSLALKLAERDEQHAATIAKQQIEIAKANDAREAEVLKARAKSDIGALAGDEATKIIALKALNTISDAKERDAVVAMFKGANAMAESYTKFSTHAIAAGVVLPDNGATLAIEPPTGVLKAHDDLKKRVEAFQAEQKIPSFAQAYAKAIQTDPKARELYGATKGN